MRRRPRSGRSPFLVFGSKSGQTVAVVASPAWESGKPDFGFPLFHPGRCQAVGMWESRAFCEISKGRWKERESCLCFSSLSTAPPFPQPFPRLPSDSFAPGVKPDKEFHNSSRLQFHRLSLRHFAVAASQQCPSGCHHRPRPFRVAALARHFVHARDAHPCL